MKSSKKLALSILAVVTALSVMLISAYALFSDNEQGAVEGKIGTLDIDLDDVDLTNKENINPGDYDPSNPPNANDGTEHDLSFTVTNNGNKSADLRNIIVISVEKEDGTKYDPTVFSLYTAKDGKYAKVGTELVVKYYKVAGSDTLVKASDFTGNTATVESIVYIPNTNVTVNGTGNGAEVETGITDHAADFVYYLVMDRNADNAYQGLGVVINVTAQAKQHRNSNDNDWQNIMTKTITVNGVKLNIVPGSGEHADGSPIV